MTRYQALYRKYRPQRFDEVVGQSHVIDTLSREVIDHKVAHAYLFAGPRGTGKTTTARLLAKSLNCPNRSDAGEPCNECPSCVGITEGTSLDVIELDAASHNKVEDVREIRVNVGTVAAAEGAHRVYILDEAHMLSRAASNALLKTLEEPPEHVVFVLATTEPYKLLDTIRSRSQRFDFHPVPTETLASYLEDIAGREGFTTEPAGLAMIATHARGSVRDAMSLLEQVAALGNGTVSAEGVTRALGLADSAAFSQLVDAITGQDAPAALGLVARLASEGADLRRFVADALGYFRGIFLAQYAPNLEEITDEPPETLDEWRRQAKTISSADVLRSIDRFSEALLQLRRGREERLVLELALIRLSRPETTVDIESLATRVDRMERDIRTGAVQAPPAAPATPAPVPPPVAAPAAPATPPPGAASPEPEPVVEPPTDEPPPAPPPETRQPAEPAAPAPAAVPAPASGSEAVTLASFSAVWPAVVSRVRSDFGARRHAFVKVAEPRSVDGPVVVLTMPAHQHFHLEQLNADDQLRAALESIASELLGSGVKLQFCSADDSAPVTPAEPERAPDPAELDAGPATPEDPTAMILDMLGGKVIEE
jgi:DNA polymerase-3 subunit gamma/tau